MAVPAPNGHGAGDIACDDFCSHRYDGFMSNAEPSDARLVWPGKLSAMRSFAHADSAHALAPRELVAAPGPAPNLLIHGDNLLAANALRTQFAGAIDLIYLDPPFDVGANFTVKLGDTAHSTLAYRDKWGSTPSDSYLQFMYDRLAAIRTLLSPTGSLFVHCDWRSAHHLRAMLDELIGKERFRNQIIWAYGSSARGAKAVAKQLARNHDVIFWYAAGVKHVFNPPSGERVYTQVAARAMGFRKDENGRWFKTAPRGDYTDESIVALEAEGRVYRTRTGVVRIKYFLETRGSKIIERTTVGDAWFDIPDAMHTQHSERTGYATQKPEALLERIVRMASCEGALIADFFCGSGVLPAVAQRLGRRWIACDVGSQAMQTTYRRLAQTVDSVPRAGFARLDLLEHEASRWFAERFDNSHAQYRQFILRALGAEFHPEKYHVLAPHEKFDDTHTFGDHAEIWVLGWNLDSATARAAENLKKNRAIHATLILLPRELIGASDDARPTFWVRPSAEITVAASTIQLRGYSVRAFNATDSQRAVINGARSPLELVDGWNIGRAPTDRAPYTPFWFSWRDRKTAALADTASLDGENFKSPLALQVCDIFGNRTLIEL